VVLLYRAQPVTEGFLPDPDRMFHKAHILTATLSALVATSPAIAQDVGLLGGSVVDRDFGGPIDGVAVTVVETGAKVLTDASGNYSIELPDGRYTVVFAKPGFVRQVKTEVIVGARARTALDVELAGEFEDMDEFVVQEIELGGSEAALRTLRLESPQLLASVGAEILSRAGASDAAAALLLIPGASVQDGKYAVIRGLPDSYVSAQLDGVRLPTADAERRAVQLDQFPTAVIESVQVSKTFTPDQQGDASGGAVNIDLKDIPEESSFEIKAQAGFNSQSAFRDDFLTYSPGGGVNTWGNNEGREIPVDLIGQGWPYPTGTTTTKAPQDYKWSASGGGKWEIDEDTKIGGFASFFYDRDSSFYDNGIEDAWVVNPADGIVPETSQRTALETFQSSLLDVTQASESVQWGGLTSFGIETENHKLGAAVLYTRLATDTATLATNTRGKAYFGGPSYDWTLLGFPDPLPEYDPNDPSSIANTFLLEASPYQRLETLNYTETTTASTILKGEHRLIFGDDDDTDETGGFLAPILDWRLSLSEAVYDQPNKSQFSAFWTPPSDFDLPGIPGRWRPLQPAENINLGWAQRIWQKVTETSTQVAVNVKLPFELDNERRGYVKFGFFGDLAERSYQQETFSNLGGGIGGSGYEGAWDDPWSALFPSQLAPMNASTFDVDYDGTQRISAVYGMFDMPLGEEFNVIGGARFESTVLQTKVFGEENATWFPPGALAPITFAGNPTAADVNFEQGDVLPSIGLQWQAHEDVVIRLNFAQTVARQTFRELTPILQQEYLGGPLFIGNPELRMSALKNYDFRIDFTPFQGWLFSGSVFYKSIELPIEYAQFNAPQNFIYTTPINYPEGLMRGIELEARVKMEVFDERLKGLALGASATVIDSEVTLPADEQEDLANLGFPISTRPMTAAPEYLLNLNATYDLEETGSQFGLFYTLQGDTLEAGAGVARENFVPSIVALPYGTLNFTFQQSVGENWKIFFQAKNLLNPAIQTVYRSEYLPGDILNTSYTAGIDFAIGASFRMDF
jgi:outer membrane receptor protein involved in Fe transport